MLLSSETASIDGMLDALPFVFQREQSVGLNARYHFTFTGNEERQATIAIADKKIEFLDGHVNQGLAIIVGKVWQVFSVARSKTQPRGGLAGTRRWRVRLVQHFCGMMRIPAGLPTSLDQPLNGGAETGAIPISMIFNMFRKQHRPAALRGRMRSFSHDVDSAIKVDKYESA